MEIPQNEPARRALRARLAAHSRWANEPDRSGATAKARQGLLNRFEREVDPDGTLDPVVRQRLAENARKAFYTKLALASAKARSRRTKPNTPNDTRANVRANALLEQEKSAAAGERQTPRDASQANKHTETDTSSSVAQPGTNALTGEATDLVTLGRVVAELKNELEEARDAHGADTLARAIAYGGQHTCDGGL